MHVQTRMHMHAHACKKNDLGALEARAAGLFQLARGVAVAALMSGTKKERKQRKRKMNATRTTFIRPESAEREEKKSREKKEEKHGHVYNA